MKDLRTFVAATIQEYLNENSATLLAPNGSPSKLPKNLYGYVRTDEFKKWFGDWENSPSNSSKVTDENGEPLLVFHGTKVKFDQFDMEKQKNGWLGKGFYFTDDKNATKEYGRTTLKIFLNIRNPFKVNGNEPNDIRREVKQKYNSFGDYAEISDDMSVPLIEHGHDGIFFKHWDKGNMFSCFTSNQVKIVNL